MKSPTMKKRLLVLLFLFVSLFVAAKSRSTAQDAVFSPSDNLVTENIPPIPASIAQKASQYAESRSAAFYGWHPTRREILIGTRLADVSQVHSVKMPGGARTPLTFFPDSVARATYAPNGDYFLFRKDGGGGEWYQYYRYDFASGDITLLTDGKSRNLDAIFAHHDNRFVYTSTRRTGKDSDIWMMAASDAKSDRMLLQLEGGGWTPLDWSPDNKKILLLEEISANETYLWLVDVGTGEKKLLTPKGGSEQIAYGQALFSKDGKGIYITTDRDSEFARLVYFDLATLQPTYLTSDIKWNVGSFDLTEDGKNLVFVTNEDGISKLYLLDTASRKYHPVTGIPTGIIGEIEFHKNNHDLVFVVTSAKLPSDVFSLHIKTGKVDRWTASETGGLNPANFVEPALVKWQTFDGKTLSGFLYKPDPQKSPGKRPVIVNIHGGPEGQARPLYQARNNYYINEMGIAIVFPNVRGSTGYGKTFLKLDNGMHRHHTHKDIRALIDWIKQNPSLDSDKIMITGGSSGGGIHPATPTFYASQNLP